MWDFLATVVLVATCLLTPYQLAFYTHGKAQPPIFNQVNRLIDAIFMVDILVSFNTSFFDQKENKFTSDRRLIARTYLKTWFWIDFIAVIDFELIIRSAMESNTTLAQVGKVAKIARFYRAIKLLRLVRMSKLAKERAKMQTRMASRMQLSVAFERLFLFGASCILFIHTLACIWILLAFENETNYVDNWIQANGFTT